MLAPLATGPQHLVKKTRLLPLDALPIQSTRDHPFCWYSHCSFGSLVHVQTQTFAARYGLGEKRFHVYSLSLLTVLYNKSFELYCVTSIRSCASFVEYWKTKQRTLTKKKWGTGFFIKINKMLNIERHMVFDSSYWSVWIPLKFGPSPNGFLRTLHCEVRFHPVA